MAHFCAAATGPPGRLAWSIIPPPLTEIADALGLSAYGVRYHIRKLFAKLGARNRAEAVRRAREMGLVPDAY